MNYQAAELNDQKYIECFSSDTPLQNEQGALDLIALCHENETSLVLINAAMLAEEFFDLKTGVAGQILQKFINYHVKTALLLTDETKIKGRFREFVNESNRGNIFRVFDCHGDALKWLLSNSS